MEDKLQIMTMVREEFNRWEALLSDLSEEQSTARDLPSDLSIKDVLGHLRAWQQISIARLDAALYNTEPVFLGWPEELDPVEESNLEQINAWIHETYQDQSWSKVHRDWREGFLQFMELAESIPERDLFEKGKYPWLEKYPLSDVLLGSYEHHTEHYEPLIASLREHGKIVPKDAPA